MTKCEQMLLTADWAAFMAQGFILHNDIGKASKWMGFSKMWTARAYNLTIADAMSIAA